MQVMKTQIKCLPNALNSIRNKFLVCSISNIYFQLFPFPILNQKRKQGKILLLLQYTVSKFYLHFANKVCNVLDVKYSNQITLLK